MLFDTLYEMCRIEFFISELAGSFPGVEGVKIRFKKQLLMAHKTRMGFHIH